MDKPVRIAIATGIYQPDLGGPATLLTELPEALRRRGLAVKIVTYSDVGLSAQEKRERLVFRISRRRNLVCRQLGYFWRLWRLARWADIIYATDTYSVGYFAYLIKKLTGKKYILRFAGDSAWETAAARGWTDDNIVDFQRKKYGRRIEKMKRRRARILTGADKVIAVSKFIAELAATIGVAKNNIRVIYNSVDFFGPIPPKTEPARPTLVFAGRLMPWKGVAALLPVVADLRSHWPDILFEILGDGPEENRLKQAARELALGDSVKFRGRVSERDSHRIFSESSIFVLNTNYEGLPHSVLNAMACSLPVVTTDIGGNREVVENGVTGLLVPYNDQAAWLAALERLLADPGLRERLVQNARKTLEKFKWNQLVTETVAVLNELMDHA